MKSTKLFFVLLFLCLVSGGALAQIEGSNAFLMGPQVQIGIHNDGFEGSSTLPSFSTAYRGYSGRLGFLSNAANDGWGNYDGDFFMPGSPENRFGIEIDGITYYNSSALGSSIPGSISSYEEYGRCKIVNWQGSIGGVDILMSYKLDTTNTYYTINVELTNTTASDMNDVFFYKSLDPDNNQEIGWGFSTQNTIVSQPDTDTASLCPKALVTATAMGYQTDGSFANNYLGLGSLDSNTRVSRGGFYVADASDVWYGTGGLIGVEGSTALADQAISICHRDETLAAGASSEFQFVVVMNEAQVPQALLKYFTLDYEDSPGFSGYCEDSLLVGPGIMQIWTDDTITGCTIEPFEMWIDGPDMDSYNWDWVDDNGDTLAAGPVALIIPGTEPDTINICCYGTPLPGTCADEMDLVVSFCKTMVIYQAPEIIVEDYEVSCGDSLLLADLGVIDTAEVPGTEVSYHTESPSSYDDIDALYSLDYLNPGDTIYVMVSDSVSECFDVEMITYTQDTAYAGIGEVSVDACNSTPVLDLNDYLVDADEDGIWEDANDPETGAFDDTNGLLTTDGLAEGSYLFYYIVGGSPCPADTSAVTVNICNQGVAGSDASVTICVPDVASIDLDDLIDGDLGGTWEEITFTAGQFNTSTGVFTPKLLPDGTYEFMYIVTSCGPCDNDTAFVTVEVAPSPDADFSFTPSSGTTEDPEIFFINESEGADTYYWTFGDGESSSEENPSHEYPAVVGSYEVWLYASNEYGCTDSTSATVNIEEDEDVCFYAPNTFTPDGNSVNKEFKPTLCEGLDIYDYHMTIYNRWGEIVFETYHFDQGWKGDYSDRGIVEEGIYIWQAEFGEVGSDKRYQLQGHITLLK